MATSLCPKCGQLSLALLPSGVCVTCHGRSDETNPASHFAPTRPAGLPPETVVAENTPADLIAAALPPVGFQFLERLGGGGMGEVFRAVELTTGREVAVKRLHPDHFTPPAVARFAAEAALLARVDHPNVVRLFQFVPDRADPFIVMECVPGEPLGVRVKGGRLPPAEAARLIAQAARGVEAAHRAGVIHRDLKPGNLLVTADGRVKVADFGLGKDLDAAHGLTQTGRVVGGTPGFVAPEQVDTDGPAVGVHTDVFGLGACLYAALTGRPPFPTGSPNLYRVLSDDLTPPRERVKGVPPDLDAIACKCLARDPAERYASAAAVADDLERFGRGEPTDARPQAWTARAWGRVRRTPRAVAAAWAVAALAVVGVAVLAAMLPFGKPTPPPEPTPAEVLAGLQTRFLAGEEVVLVPEKGLPKWSKWVVGDADLREGPKETEGAGFFRPHAGAALLLFEPPSESYRVSCELRHVSAAKVTDHEACRVGVMLFHHEITKDERTADTAAYVTYADFDAKWHLTGTAGKSAVEFGLVSRQWVPPLNEFGQSAKALLGQDPHPFQPLTNTPGPWRKVVAEVSADGLKIHWSGDILVKPEEIASFDPNQLNRTYTELHTGVKKNAAGTGKDADLVPSLWRPTGGLGLWAGHSGLAFRNVTVRRTP